MTSSKSQDRASGGRSSISIPEVQNNGHDPDNVLEDADLSKLQLQNSHTSAKCDQLAETVPSVTNQPAMSIQMMVQPGDEPVLTFGPTSEPTSEPTPVPTPVAMKKKSQSRLNFRRLSAFFPSLTSLAHADQGQSVLHRKPIPSDSPILPERPKTSHSDLTFGHSSNPTSEPSGHHRHFSEHDPFHLKKLQKHVPAHPDHPPPPPPPKPFDTVSTSPKQSPNVVTKPRPRSTSHSHDRLAPRSPSPSDPRGRSSSAQPPGSRMGLGFGSSRNVSTAVSVTSSHPESRNTSPSPGGEKRGRLRRSWLPGSRSRSGSQDIRGVQTAGAWILGQTNTDYNTAFLVNGEKVPELWNENGDVLVYLHPMGSGQGPSFKVPSFAVDYSLVFRELIEVELTSPSVSERARAPSFVGRDNLSVADAQRQAVQMPPSPTDSESNEMKLYLPVSQAARSDLDSLVAIRNTFAFLTGQPLVATKAQPTLFSVFMRISSLLKEFEFTNADGSSFGEAVEMSFSFFMEQTALADVRHSREKTLESLILGERMKSWELYNEAFAHAAGKYTAIRDLKSSLWDHVSSHTRQKLERAHLDLVTRQNSVNNRLESFDFPSLFSGVANSTSLDEYKDVKFSSWRRSFHRMKQFVLGYYKTSFGSWPPKARSKKNPFSESGLNRQVLKILYSDLCALYDLTVDRESITPRGIDQTAEDMSDDLTKPHISALRKILMEFDQSSPPVLPPIPFDVPKLPDMTSIKANFYELLPKEQLRLEKNLQEHEFLLILNKSYDFETFKLKIPFLEEFKEFERKEAKGLSVADMVDQRIGYWLFMYVVIQSLPMLVVDAPGLKFTEGVEYFLCQPPKGQPPWMGDVPEIRKRWYQIPGTGGYVELSADAVEFSVEGIYQRSHCWLAAKRWEADSTFAPPPQETLSPLQAPQSVFTDMDPNSGGSSPKMMARSESPPSGVIPQPALRPRKGSPANNSSHRASIVFGLEPVAMPNEPPNYDRRGSRVFSAKDGPMPARPLSMVMARSRSSGYLPGYGLNSPASTDSRTSSRQDSVGGSTFDDILKDIDKKPKTKKKSGLFG